VDTPVGSAWSNYVHSEVSPGTGQSVLDQKKQFDIGASTYNFDAATDTGAYLTLTGLTEHNGIYRINRVISSKVVELDTNFSVSDAGIVENQVDVAWRLWRPTATYCPVANDVAVLGGLGTTGGGFPFHLHMNVRATNSYFPEFILSPFASWNAGTHAWTDSKRISAKGIDNWNNSVINVDNCRVFAAGDADRMVIMLRMEDDYYAWHFIYLGEIDTSYPVLDTRPCVVVLGSNRGNATAAGDNVTLFGTGADSSIYSGALWLAHDDVTSIAGRMMYYHCPVNADSNYYAGKYRVFSQINRQRYLQQIVCESLTSGYMEIRGALRRVWLTTQDDNRFMVLGNSGNFAHIVGGVVLPWNASPIYYQR
jgi:hypothetical protein